MADAELQNLTELTDPAAADVIYVVDDPSGSPLSRKVTFLNALKKLFGTLDASSNEISNIDSATVDEGGTSSTPAAGKVRVYAKADGLLYSKDDAGAETLVSGGGGGGGGGLLPPGRLTLTTGVPVTTSDVLAATTIYYTPKNGNKININGTDLIFSEVSVSVPTGTVTPFDVFGFDNSGTLALETLDWTNDTTRATDVIISGDGRYYKSGDTTRLYLGTGRTTGVSGQTEDSEKSRLLWNNYNRVTRSLLAFDTTANWMYTLAVWRASNASTTLGTGRFDFVIGVREDIIEATHYAIVSGTSNAAAGIGLDSTSVNSAQLVGGFTTSNVTLTAHYKSTLVVGYHFLQMIEISAASGTTTWNGQSGTAPNQSGMIGTIRN
jgi:hypothetical protein